MNDYKFMIKNSDKAFYNLVNYTINTNSYYNYRNSGLESLSESFLEGSSFEQVYTIILIIIFVPLIILSIIYFVLKHKRAVRKLKLLIDISIQIC